MVVGSPHSQEIPQWFAMRVTYKRELAVKDLLDAQGVESFIPMHKVVRQLRGRKKWSLEPVVHNLLFVHACKSWLQQFKVKLPHLQYMTQRSDGKNHPIVVRDEEMQRFMEVTRTYDEQLLFFKTEELDLAKGTKVSTVARLTAWKELS